MVSPVTAAQMRDMLTQVITDGTGRAAAIDGYAVAGKTGTARKPQPGGGYTDGAGRYHYISTFAGFLPADDPKLSIVVVIDEPTTSPTPPRWPPQPSPRSAATPCASWASPRWRPRPGARWPPTPDRVHRPAPPATVPPQTTVPPETTTAATPTDPMAAAPAAPPPDPVAGAPALLD